MPQDEETQKLLNQIFLGEVASVHNYGAFIRIPGRRSQGLVHRSQVSKAVVDDVTEVLERGERVWCKVINITEDNKIGLSMKVVDQGNGRDLDPNGVLIHQEEQRRKSQPLGSQRQIIHLDAVFKTTCTKCGTKGHLSKDCFQSPDGKTYELIPDDDDDPTDQAHSNEKDVKSKKDKKKKEKRKKHKKEKETRKKKSKAKRKRMTSSSSSSDTSSDEKAKKKRKHGKDHTECDHHSKHQRLSESSSDIFQGRMKSRR